MTLKNFFKRNFTISLLIIFSLIVIVNNFYRFFQNNNVYEFDPWFSNYQGGFVRRGIPGEFFFQLYDSLYIHPGWMIFIFVSTLYFLFYLSFFHLVKKIKIDRLTIFAFFSPIAFYFPVLNSKASGQKDIIFLCLLSIFCIFLPKMKRFHANCFMILISIFVALSHEGLLFYSMYLIIPYLLFFEFKNLKHLIINFIPLALILFILLFLTYNFHGTPQHVLDICNSIKDFVNTQCTNVGQIALLAFNLEWNIAWKDAIGNYKGTYNLPIFPKYYLIYGIGFVVGFLPLVILYGRSKMVKNPIYFLRMHPLVFLFLPFLATIPIYYAGFDWGRYLYISYISSLIIIIFCLGNNIFTISKKTYSIKDNIFLKFLFVISIIVYGFGWTVPICCELSFKPGIPKAFERIVYYYNTEK